MGEKTASLEIIKPETSFINGFGGQDADSLRVYIRIAGFGP